MARWRLGRMPWGRKIIMTMRADAEDEHPPLRLELDAEDVGTTESLGQVGDDHAAEDHARQVAGAAEHDGGEEEDGQDELEGVGRDGGDVAGVERAREAADGRADGEGPQLVLERGHAHQLGGVLVLADGRPGPPYPAALEAPHQEHHEDDHDERQPVVGRGVEHVELEGADVGRAGHVGDAVGPAEPSGVLGDDPHDLAEAQRDDGQVVAPQPQRRRAEQEARDHGDDHADGHADQPRQRHRARSRARRRCRRRRRRRRRSRGRAGRLARPRR